MKHDVVVGGGIAGIAAALLLVGKGRRVTLIEPEPELGGLLRSKLRGGGGYFDYGTHILTETGHAELDALLFGDCRDDDWVTHKVIASSTCFGGRRTSAQFLDARSLPPETYARALREMFDLPSNSGPFANLEERLLATYGPTFAAHLFRPVMQKFTGLDLEKIADRGHLLFGLKRLLCGTPDEAREWKRAESWHDERLAFHSAAEGASSSSHFYPKHHGIGLWATRMTGRLHALGVTVRTGTSVDRVRLEAGRAAEVQLSSGETLPCSRLIWSASVVALLRAAGLPLPTASSPPELCRMLIVDMLLDGPLLLEDFYSTYYDPGMNLFRTTNYSALQGTPPDAPRHRITAEVIVPPGARFTQEVTPEALLNEMRAIGVLSSSTRMLRSWTDDLKHGFPLPTPTFQAMSEALAARAEETCENLVLLGRASGRTFFMSEVLVDTYRLIA